jgi:hypothetical protein
MTKLEAWAVMHNSHGLHLDSLLLCKEGEGPDKKPHCWHRQAWIRIPWLDGEIDEAELSKAEERK